MTKKLTLMTAVLLFGMHVTAHAQQFDVAFGLGGLIGPSSASASGNHSPQTIGGGTFMSVSGDYLLKKQLGISGEVAWRAKQNLYGAFQPFRPILWDFNGIWAPQIGNRVGAEMMAGIGAQSTHFYQSSYFCGFTGCTNYTSSNHFMGHLGGGIRLYVTRNFFIRPEAHLYMVRNNFEFSGNHASRVGISIGYSSRTE